MRWLFDIDENFYLNIHWHALTKNLCTKVGKLQSLVVFEGGNGKSLWNASWIGCVDTVGILPHGNTRGSRQLGKDSGTVIRTRSLERGGYSVNGGGDETGHHNNGGNARLAIAIVHTTVFSNGVPPVGETGGGFFPEGSDTTGGGGGAAGGGTAPGCSILDT